MVIFLINTTIYKCYFIFWTVFPDVFMSKEDEDLHRSALEKIRDVKTQNFSDIFKNRWKIKNHKMAYKLLYMAQHGAKTERFKAVTALSSLSNLKGVYCYVF